MNKLIVISTVVSSIVLAGCESTPEVKPRMARFDSPEVNSQPFHFNITAGSDSSNQIAINKNKKSERDNTLRFSAVMTLGKGFEARFVDNGENQVSLKYQMLGAPLEQKKTGNLSLAGSLGYIWAKRSESPTKQYNDWSMEQKSYDLSLIAGYRLNRQAILYGSVFYQNGDVDGKYYLFEHYDVEQNVTINEGCGWNKTCVASYFSDKGNAYGLSLALEYEVLTWLAVTGEVVHHRAEWFERTNNETGAHFNVEFRF